MSRQRRRAENFTDSLNSFQLSISSGTLHSISQDSLDQIKHRLSFNASRRSSEHSPILDDSYATNLLTLHASSLPGTPVRAVPDLNKRIDLYQSNSLKDESISNSEFQRSCMKFDSKENNDPQCAIKGYTGSRDINRNKEELAGIQKFERILCSLDNQLNQIKEVSQTESTLKRLSEKFVNSPENFTEKLVTIIEESIINTDEDTCNATGFNLSRLTLEFRKMCKFIEDETCPEWAPSLFLSPSSEDASVSPVEKLSGSMKTTSVHSTPLSATEVLKKRFFQKISKNHFNGSTDSITNMSTTNVSSLESFERLELQCKKSFPEERETSGNLRRSFSMSSLLSMTAVKEICDQQLALLNISDSNNKEKVVSSTPNLHNKYIEQPLIDKSYTKVQKESDYKFTDMSYSKKKAIKFNKGSDSNNISADELRNVYTKFDTDELEKTILQDIAEKRKRCLDTARILTEINGDTEIIDEIESLSNSPIYSAFNGSNAATNNEAKFLNTLMSCKDYMTYLEKQKPFLDLYEKSEFYAPNNPLQNKDEIGVKNVEDRHALKTNLKIESHILKKRPLNSYGIHYHRSPLARKEGKEYREKTEHFKPKFFVSPGKSPSTTKYKRKEKYFPDICNIPKNNLDTHIFKSPQTTGLYRWNYNTVVSPVGMYIRGTDMQLIKNVHSKTDNWLLTPTKKTFESSLGRDLKQSTPLNGTSKYQEKKSLKFNLSPKVGLNQMHKQKVIVNAETSSAPNKHLILPKVSYKLPLQVETIKESKSSKMGNRVKKLLECTENKLVIRHEGKIKSQCKQQDTGITPTEEVMEIHYEPEDISIHVEQAASKTNFIHKKECM